ncbi:MAG: N-formylglutamate amidohydrolase [Pseudomonadota bacterium]
MADGTSGWNGAVERISPSEGSPDTGWRAVVICDHARNAQPPGIDLGLSDVEMARHIAFDPGARGTVVELARRLRGPAVMSTFSRLVIDPNRGEDDPTLVMRLYDGTIIPGNRHVETAEIEARLAAYHRPYHHALDAALDAVIAAGEVPLIVSIHSFTPQLRGRAPRPWQIGLLYDKDVRVAEPLYRVLEDMGPGPDGSAPVIGDNEPYSGQLRGDCLWRHGTMRGIAHVLVEIRNDLIATPADEIAWAAHLDRALRRALPPQTLGFLAPSEPLSV